MSSHHVVLDSQESALLIANGESCSDELLNQLLEWTPFTVVLDGALERFLAMNKVFDVFLGDFDNRNRAELKTLLPPQVRIEYLPDQNSTDLEKGLNFLIENGHKSVNIIWATGKRSDHFLNNIAIVGRYSDKINPTLLDNYSVIYPVKNGFKKYFKKDSNISLMPLTKVVNLTTRNLVWDSYGQSYEFPFSSSSSNKVAENGLVEVYFESGILLLMECLD